MATGAKPCFDGILGRSCVHIHICADTASSCVGRAHRGMHSSMQLQGQAGRLAGGPPLVPALHGGVHPFKGRPARRGGLVAEPVELVLIVGGEQVACADVVLFHLRLLLPEGAMQATRSAAEQALAAVKVHLLAAAALGAKQPYKPERAKPERSWQTQ